LPARATLRCGAGAGAASRLAADGILARRAVSGAFLAALLRA